MADWPSGSFKLIGAKNTIVKRAIFFWKVKSWSAFVKESRTIKN